MSGVVGFVAGFLVCALLSLRGWRCLRSLVRVAASSGVRGRAILQAIGQLRTRAVFRAASTPACEWQRLGRVIRPIRPWFCVRAATVDR